MKKFIAFLLFCSGTVIFHNLGGVDVSDPEVDQEVGVYFGPGATGAFRAENGMVSSASAHASLAGLDILRRGGNAVDAAVAVQFVLMVTEPYGSGIGGGLFAVGYDTASDEVYTVDGREEAPAAFGPNRFRNEDGRIIPFRQRITGGNPVGVPGTLAACQLLLDLYGTMTLSEVMQPAIHLARVGVPVSEPFATNLLGHWDRLKQFEATRILLGREDGTPLQQGDLFKNPDLATTLEDIAREGTDFFYRGPLAIEIVAAVIGDSVQPGVLTLQDMDQYRAVRREPIHSELGPYTVYGMGMPSSGGVTLAFMLNLLAQTNYADLPPFSPEAIQRLIDVQNLAFADRSRYLADADFVDVPVAGLLSLDYARERIKLLSADVVTPTPIEPGNPFPYETNKKDGTVLPESPSTTHFTVVDADRNMIAISSTLEQHFGSGVTVPGRGFLLNNELTDFDRFHRTSAGRILANAADGERRVRRTALPPDDQSKGGKRPRSSMTPTLVFKEGNPYLTIGSPGGSRIIGVTFTTLLQLLIHDEELQQAINLPRVISRNGTPELETPLFRNQELLQELAERNIEPVDAQAVGSVQAILLGEDGWLYGAADPRREGFAIGY